MPQRFTWNGGDVYLPLKLTYASDQFYGVAVKLKRGVGLQAANAEVDALLQRFAKETPAHFPRGFRAHTKWLNDEICSRLGIVAVFVVGGRWVSAVYRLRQCIDVAFIAGHVAPA